MLSLSPLSLDSIMLDEARAYLRIENAEEDAPLGAILLAAISHAERIIGQILIQREIREIQNITGHWQRLSCAPATEIIAVNGIPAEGSAFAMPAENYALDLSRDGDAIIRILQAGSAGRFETIYRAGLASDWDGLPESLRIGILRLCGHYYNHRDGADDNGPPTAIMALLRPFRRLQFGHRILP